MGVTNEELMSAWETVFHRLQGKLGASSPDNWKEMVVSLAIATDQLRKLQEGGS